MFDLQGTMLRVAVMQQLEPAPYTVLGWAVADIDQAVDALAKRGVEFRRYEGIRSGKRSVTPGTIADIHPGDFVLAKLSVDFKTARSDIDSGTPVPVSKLLDGGSSPGPSPSSFHEHGRRHRHHDRSSARL